MLIVENGSGVPNANSYLSVADADAYAALYGNPAAWVDAQAVAILTLGVQPLDGETITIGSTVYTYKTTPTPTDKEIPIGTTVTLTLKNTKDVINADIERNPDIPPTTTPHPDVQATTIVGSNLTIQAKVGGSAGNAITLSELFSDPANIFLTDTLTGGEESKEEALRFASQYLDAEYGPRWIGFRHSRTQGLFWPRNAAVPHDGFHLSSEELPEELLDATAEMAFKAVIGEIFDDDNVNSGLIAEEAVRVGPLSERIKYVSGKQQGIKKFRKVTKMLFNIITPRGVVRRG